MRLTKNEQKLIKYGAKPTPGQRRVKPKTGRPRKHAPGSDRLSEDSTRYTFIAHKNQLEALRALEGDKSLSQHIREAIDLYLCKR